MNYNAKDDYVNKDSMSMPWVESPFFESILQNLPDLKIIAKFYFWRIIFIPSW